MPSFPWPFLMNPLPGITGSFVGSINCQRAESAGIFPQSRVPEFTVFLKIGKGFRVFRMGIKEQCDIIDSKHSANAVKGRVGRGARYREAGHD